MKKLLTLVLALAMTLSLAACGGGGEDTADEGSEGSTVIELAPESAALYRFGN